MIRALAVLCVVVGVLGMHALPTAHHGAAALVPAAGAHAEHQDPHILSGAGKPAAAAASGAVGALSLATGKHCYGTCEAAPQSVLVLCAGVLLAAGAGLALAAEARRRTTGARTAVPRASYPSLAAVPRRVDPVAELCVNRT